ncbi:ketopantoate reductase family protein [Paenibacillus pinistramenti]|uniref:ketopantoate reductase family protein n=1 Tax=Paenibacillus pinistramenti TaxID=1768003 RepID=UPI001EF12A88|nr:2-dehydropantoate 2-reductase [Paenibacillus pinistramenti]
MGIDIVGAGAIGLLFAARLRAAGSEVRLWTRTAEQAELINHSGIKIQQQDGTEQTVSGVMAAPFAESAYQQEKGSSGSSDAGHDWILLAVKQRHLTEDLLARLSSLHAGKRPVVCLQNGMGHLERIAQAVPREYLSAAVTTEGAKRPEANHIIRSKPGRTSVGALLGCEFPALENLAAVLSQAGFEVSVSKEIEKEIHRKLLVNAAINPLTAIWRIPNGELLATAEREEMLERLIMEGIAVYSAAGILFEEDLIGHIKSVCRSTSGNISSMLSDVMKGAETEVDYINGYLVELAAQAGISCPAHEMVWRLVKGLLQAG